MSPNVDEMKASKDVTGLITALGQKDLRISAATALGEIGDPRAVEPLIGLLKEGDIGTRLAAVAGLTKIGAPAIEPLLARLQDAEIRGGVVWALGKIAEQAQDTSLLPDLVDPIITVLEDRRGNVRSAGVEALGKVGARLDAPLVRARVEEVLTLALKDKDADARKEASTALEKMGKPSAIPVEQPVQVKRSAPARPARSAPLIFGKKPGEILVWVGVALGLIIGLILGDFWGDDIFDVIKGALATGLIFGLVFWLVGVVVYAILLSRSQKE